MKITRRGARADNGPSNIELNNPRISLDGENIIIRDSDVKDFVTKAHYNYKIEISLYEVGEILESVGSYPDEMKEKVGKTFECKLKELLRIIQSCIDA